MSTPPPSARPFPAVLDFAQEIVLAATEEAAVTSNDAGATPSLVGAVAIGSNGAKPGFTSGPDLLGITTDPTGQILLVFDEELAGERDDIDASGCQVLTSEGDLVAAREVVELDDDRLIVAFDPHLTRAAAGYVVVADTLTDRAGDGNALITTR